MTTPDFDEHGQWTGTCDTCGTDHGGHGPGTLGAATRCLRSRAEALGATHVLDRLDEFGADQEDRRDAALSAFFADETDAGWRAEALRLVSEGWSIDRAITHVHDFGVGW